MSNNINMLFGQDARDKMIEGALYLAQAVGCTLGPRGRNVVYGQGTIPRVTKDGVSVAKMVQLDDPYMNMGAQMIRQAAMQANSKAGDGTTTSTVLAASILRRASAGALYGVKIQRELQQAAEYVISKLEQYVMPVDNKETIEAIARISANGDDSISSALVKIFEQIGSSGVIKIAKSERNTKDIVSYTNGFEIPRGYIAPEMINSRSSRVAHYTEPFVFIYNGEFDESVLRVLSDKIGEETLRKPFVIIANEYTENVERLLAMGCRRGYQFLAIRSPGYGSHRDEMLEDLAIYAGTQVYVKENLSEEDIELGSLPTITAHAERTEIVGDSPYPAAVNARVSELRVRIRNAPTEAELQRCRSRLAWLTSGCATYEVGGADELDVSERYDRVVDAVCAVRAAMLGGVVPGGGVTMLRLSKELEALDTAGAALLAGALSDPFNLIGNNAGYSAEELNGLAMSLLAGDKQLTWDATTMEVGDFMTMGVVDPETVTRTAIHHATSVAGIMLTTECMIFDQYAPERLGVSRERNTVL